MCATYEILVPSGQVSDTFALAARHGCCCEFVYVLADTGAEITTMYITWLISCYDNDAATHADCAHLAILMRPYFRGCLVVILEEFLFVAIHIVQI